MGKLNIEQLIYELRNTEFNANDRFREQAADLLQSQAERIAGLEKEVAFQIKMKEQHSKRLSDERDTLRAQLVEIEKTEPVFYEFQWTNPGNQPNQPESMFVWARVEPHWNGTVQQKVDELLAYRYEDKPTYRVRALFTLPMSADVTELVELLEFMWRDVPMNEYAFEKLEAALSKYKGAK